MPLQQKALGGIGSPVKVIDLRQKLNKAVSTLELKIACLGDPVGAICVSLHGRLDGLLKSKKTLIDRLRVIRKENVSCLIIDPSDCEIQPEGLVFWKLVVEKRLKPITLIFKSPGLE